MRELDNNSLNSNPSTLNVFDIHKANTDFKA